MHIGKNKTQCESKNWNSRVDKCIKLLKTWKARYLSLKGKVLIANSLIISRVIYVLNLSHISDEVVTKRDNTMLSYNLVQIMLSRDHELQSFSK